MAKTWLITGCSAGGIGEGIARAVLEAGDNAVITARSTDKLQGIVDDYPQTALAVALDLTEQASIDACFAAAVRNNTPLDRVGVYQGVRIFTIVLIPMLVGPWIGSTISASSGAMAGFGVVGDGFTPSSLIFAGGAVVALLTFIVLAFIRREERQ